MMKKISMFLILSLFAVTTIVFAQKYKVDFKTVKDGTYKGVYQGTFEDKKGDISVEVTVAGGKLTKINLVKAPHDKIKKASVAAFKTMIEKNDIDADAKTMATLKAAVYNAVTAKK